jgi:hypothetical protein
MSAREHYDAVIKKLHERFKATGVYYIKNAFRVRTPDKDADRSDAFLVGIYDTSKLTYQDSYVKEDMDWAVKRMKG